MFAERLAMPKGRLTMARELDDRPSDVGDDDEAARISALLQALETVRALADTSTDMPGPGQRAALAARVTEIVRLLTDGDFAPFLNERLLDVTYKSHAELIAAVNPSLRLLKRRATLDRPGRDGEADLAGEADAPMLVAKSAGVDEIALALAKTEGETGYGIGDFVMVQNPYMVTSDLRLKEADPMVVGSHGSLDEARLHGRGGELRNFNGEGPWQTTDSPLGHIPHPGETGSLTWYWVTGKNPKEVYDAWKATDQTAWNGMKSRARNIVKSVEIEYAPNINAGDSTKAPHLILLYAGGNST